MRCNKAVLAAILLLVCIAGHSAKATPFANVTASFVAHLQGFAGAALPSGVTLACDGAVASSCDTSVSASYRGEGQYSLDQSVIRSITIRNISAAVVPLNAIGLYTDVTAYAHSSAGVGVDDGVTQTAWFEAAVYLWLPGSVSGLLDEHGCRTTPALLACPGPGFSGDDNAYTFPLAALAPGGSITIQTGVQLRAGVDAPEPASVAVLGSALLAGIVLRRRRA